MLKSAKVSHSECVHILDIRSRANFILMSQFMWEIYRKPIEIQFTELVFVARRVFPIRHAAADEIRRASDNNFVAREQQTFQSPGTFVKLHRCLEGDARWA